MMINVENLIGLIENLQQISPVALKGDVKDGERGVFNIL